MKIYLASRYSRRIELMGYRHELQSIGHKVTSRWLDLDHQDASWRATMSDDVSTDNAAELRCKFATEDFNDVLAADVLIAFTESPSSNSGRGGRHVELGIAIGRGKPVYVVGHRENIFCWLGLVRFHESFQSVIADLMKCSICDDVAEVSTGMCRSCSDHAY